MWSRSTALVDRAAIGCLLLMGAVSAGLRHRPRDRPRRLLCITPRLPVDSGYPAWMRRSDLMLLLVTAASWGSSFMFIKVAIEELTPLAVMVLRCAIGAIPMWMAAAWLRRRRGGAAIGPILRDARDRRWSLLALGLMTGIPLWLVALGEEHVDSGLAGVVNASVPLWAALLALHFDAEHRTGRRRMAGVLVGFGGVLLLAVARGSIGGGGEALGIGLVASAGLLYASSAILVRERLGSLPSVESAAWSITIAAAAFAVPVVATLPSRMPSAQVVGSVVALGLLGTFLGFLAYYELLDRVGATRATMVTYLLPPLALGYGWLLLGERVGAESIAAMVVILAGVWLGSRAERTTPPPVTVGEPGGLSATAR